MTFKTNLMVAGIALGATLTAVSPASATNLSYYMGTLTIDPTTLNGSLSASTTLVYSPVAATKKKPASSTLSYSFGPPTVSGSVKGISPATFDPTQIDYTFKIATPVELLYGQTINTVLGNRVALGMGSIQLLDLSTSTVLTPVVAMQQTGMTNQATTAKYVVNLSDTDDTYALRVIGNVPIRTKKSPGIYVQYSPSVFATAVPEPAAWTMMILGVTGVGAAIRRRRMTPVVA